MTIKLTADTIDAAVNDVQSFLNGPELPCTNLKNGAACAKQHEGFDKDGRPFFWYGIDCPVPRKHFCAACLSYWLAGVLRNTVRDAMRVAGVGQWK